MLPTLQYIYIVLFLFANVRNFSLKQKPLAILRSFKYHSSSPSSSSSATELQLYTTLSFYKFANTPLKNPEEIVKVVSENLKGIDLKGTLVFANEGVNAQITLKDSDLNQFTSILAESDPFLKDINLNIGERKNISQTGAALPFKKLVVRTKKQILTDGLDNNATDIDWSQAGPELDGEAWHNEVKEVPPLKSIDEVSSSSSSKVILLDCRNDYETEMGTFQNSIPLNTVKFSDSWEILEGILADVPKDTRVLTFCTGGIRCVKVNAYLRKHLGFNNTARLKDGILGYERWLETSEVSHDDIGNESSTTENKSSQSLFIGKNFVFDRRRLADNE